MRILIDLDGIAADLLGKWLRVYNEEWGENVTPSDIKQWAIHESINPRCGKDIYKMIERPAFFDNLEPLPGAVEAIPLLQQHHKVRIATAAAGPDSARAKLTWCERVLGISHKDVFLTRKKHWIEADLLIDDKPEAIRAWRNAKRPYAATIAYPYNHEIAGYVNCFAQDYQDTERAWAEIVAWVETLG
jgi:5'(3')-deoxyribonucleotidase